jgi:hypothetical protein
MPLNSVCILLNEINGKIGRSNLYEIIFRILNILQFLSQYRIKYRNILQYDFLFFLTIIIHP